ncbi:hypothetical protein CMV_024628 [Castanea mollissima]|uniref:Uncharacterized protein n=1 Tax=Castanea mollissima TaxID=60419 RepID=A0A8J4QR72_9ROSI|nr:hypothetical protein CMV_024628 [Castanea mollissima]
MFVTKDREERQVRYGEREDMLDDMVVTHVERYERENMCEAPANMSVGWRDPGWIHDGIMKNLKKGARRLLSMKEPRHFSLPNSLSHSLSQTQSNTRRSPPSSMAQIALTSSATLVSFKA